MESIDTEEINFIVLGPTEDKTSHKTMCKIGYLKFNNYCSL